MKSENALDEISRLVSLQPITDGRIDSALVFAGIASWAWWAAYLLEAWFSLFSTITGKDAGFLRLSISLVALLATMPLAYLIYRIVNRRNEHFGRSEALLEEMIGTLNFTGQPVDRAVAISNAVHDFRSIVWEQKERSGYLLSLLSLLPFSLVGFLDRSNAVSVPLTYRQFNVPIGIGWPFVFVGWFLIIYSLYAVTRDYVRHERREFLVLGSVQIGLGIPTPSVTGWYLHERSLAYFLLSIFTLGLFTLAWVYIAIHDPEPHFHIQAQLENNIHSTLRKR